MTRGRFSVDRRIRQAGATLHCTTSPPRWPKRHAHRGYAAPLARARARLHGFSSATSWAIERAHRRAFRDLATQRHLPRSHLDQVEREGARSSPPRCRLSASEPAILPSPDVARRAWRQGRLRIEQPEVVNHAVVARGVHAGRVKLPPVGLSFIAQDVLLRRLRQRRRHALELRGSGQQRRRVDLLALL